MPDTEPTIDQVRASIQRAGLSLTDDELEKMRRSAVRLAHWAETTRELISPDTEPAYL